MSDLIKMSPDKFIKIINGDYIDDPKYKKYYDKEDNKICFDSIILDEHIVFNNLMKPYYQTIWVYDSEVKSTAIAFWGGELDIDLQFLSVRFREEVFVMNKDASSLTFEGCVFESSIRFTYVETKIISISDCGIFALWFFEGTVNQFNLSDSKVHLSTFFRNMNCESFESYNCEFRSLEFNMISGKSFKISNFKSTILSLKEIFSKDILFQIIDANVVNISYNSFINLGTFYFTGASEYKKKKLNTLSVKNSDLGKMTLIDIDLSGFKLIFKSSKITDLFLTETKMPLPENIISDNFEQKRQILSQLKKVHENRGDSIEAGKYQAEELNIHLKTLKNGWEKINLCLNKLTNNHGQDLSRAFWVTIIGSSICYLIYCLLLGFRLNFSELGFKELGRIALYFPEYLNPIRKIDVLYNALKINSKDGSGVPASVSAWDNISRIFITYFLYQFIAAFRKHGKKSS